MTKRIVIGACLMAMAASMFAAPKKAEGKVLNIYVWNDEFPSRFNDYYASKVPADVKVNFIQTPNADNAYQNKLDEALLQQATAKDDDKIDIFLVESDYALKYVDTPYTLDVMKDIGLTKKDLANQFKYTKDVVTTPKGVLKGVTWQACPAGFVYRRSFAKKVLGTDDPAKVQEKISDWNKFDAVAAQMKAAGYYMISGYDDTFRVFTDNVTKAWVKGNKIQIDPMVNRWIEQTKTYTDKGYNQKTSLWGSDWMNGMMADGKVFGYFGPAWFVDYSMPHGDGSAFGDWAFCKGPMGYSWGGTWICAAAGTDNVELIKDIMKTMTCDETTMVKIAKEAGDFTNNEPAMQKVAASDYKNAFLGGQNHMAFFIQSAASIDKSKISKYDQGCSEKIQNAMKDYFDGKVDLNTAWDNFYTSITETYPNLKK